MDDSKLCNDEEVGETGLSMSFCVCFGSSMMQQGANGAVVSPGTQQNGTVLDSGGVQTNGNITAETDGDAGEVNGEGTETITTKIMDKTNQDIVRLIGQHLKTVGLEYVVPLCF